MAAAIPIAFQVGAMFLTAGMSAITSALIVGGATLLGGYLASKLVRGKEPEIDLRANYVSTDKTIPLIYGTRLIGSNDVFIAVGKDGTSSSGGKGKYIWIVSTLCEGEIDGFNQIEVDGKVYDEIYINGSGIWKKENKGIRYWLYVGANDQDRTEGLQYLYNGTRIKEEERATDLYRNTAFVIFRIPKKNKNFSGIPRREMVVRGIKCLDVRTPDDPKRWTSNPALILYDYLTNSRYGLNTSVNIIDADSFGVIANLCEPDQDDWDLNYVISTQRGAQSIIDSMLAHFRGYLNWWNGKISLRYIDSRWEVPLNVITDEHIARDDTGKAIISVSQPSNFDIPDGILVSYINQRENWATDTIPIGEEYGQIKSITFEGYIRREKALEMGTYTLERQRLNRTYNMILKSEIVEYDVNDVVEMTISEIGMSNQRARIKNSSISGEGLINITTILEKEELYDKEYQPDSSEIYSVDFPGISEVPPSVENIHVEEEVYYYRERSFVRLNISFDEPDGYPWFSHVDVYVTYNEGTNYNTWNRLASSAASWNNLAPDTDDWNTFAPGTTTWNSFTPTGPTWHVFAPYPATWNDIMIYPDEDDYRILMSASDDFQVDPVEEGAIYYLKFVSVSTYGVRQEFDEAPLFQHEVVGVSGVYPEDPPYLWAVTNQTSVDLLSEKFTDPDIAGYEMRLSAVGTTPPETWNGSIFLSFRSSPDVSYSGVKPGIYKFWLGARHKNNNYSLNPQTTIIENEDPPPGSYNFYSNILNYSDGVTENLIISGTYPNQTINVDHDAISQGQALTGRFISDEFNIDPNGVNTDGVSLSYLLFDFWQESYGPSAQTWTNLAPSPDTWNDFAPLDPEPITWNDILGPIASAEAARIDVSFQYSLLSGGPYSIVNRMELLTAIIEGGYIRVIIEITDVVESRYMVVGPSTFKAGYLESALLIGA